MVDTESYDSWLAFLRAIRSRGAAGVRLVVSDAHPGLVRALGEVFQGAAWQRCAVHLMRDCMRDCKASKRATLLRRCALPAPKTFDGYDWSAVSWPEDMGRESLLALDFVERREDLVLMGDVGTGKTHMASALCALACERRLEARFFTASSLVMRLRRARDDGRIDREAALIGKARLLVIDELGFLPLDADGARLLFQVFVCSVK